MLVGTVLTPIPPIDVSAFIPVGTTTVVFDLRDFGAIASNTDLFLVTTATVTPTQPAIASNAFDAGTDLSGGQLSPVVVAAFQAAFEKQVIKPVLKQLEEAHADPETIAKIEQQLKQASLEKANVAATALTSLLDGQTLLSKLQRNLGELFQEPATPPTSIEKFVANVGVPKITINQSINDILAFGFNPEQVEFEWKDIAAEFTVNQAAVPQPVSATRTGGGAQPGSAKITGGVEGKIGPDGKPCVEAELGIKGGGITATADGKTCANGDTTVSVGVKVEEDVPDLSLTGFIALLIVVIALGALRRKPAASGAA